MQWHNGFFGVSKAAALGWARGPGKRSERRSRLKAICPNAMRSFWKVAAFRLTDSIRILSGRRALRCFQNELHHFIILNLKWYYISRSDGFQGQSSLRNACSVTECLSQDLALFSQERLARLSFCFFIPPPSPHSPCEIDHRQALGRAGRSHWRAELREAYKE